MRPPVALAVAGHDPLGGAGIAADLTTFAALGVHGVAALTAVTAQHLDAVDRFEPVADDLVAAQLDGIVADIAPAAMKTGLLASTAVVETIGRRIAARELPAPVVDPVLVDGSGRRIVAEDVEAAYRRHLFPVAAVITPNRAEVELILGRRIESIEALVEVAPELTRLGAPLVVVTGGSRSASGSEGNGSEEAVDVVVDADGTVDLITGSRHDTINVRGSGCTFSAAIAAGMAQGQPSEEAVRAAKDFVADRIADAADWDFRGRGPVSHRFADEGQGMSAHSSP